MRLVKRGLWERGNKGGVAGLEGIFAGLMMMMMSSASYGRLHGVGWWFMGV